MLNCFPEGLHLIAPSLGSNIIILKKFDVSDLCDPVEYTLNSQPSSQMASLLSEQFEYMLSQLSHGLLKEDLIILDILGQEKEFERHFQTQNTCASLRLLTELLGCSDSNSKMRSCSLDGII